LSTESQYLATVSGNLAQVSVESSQAMKLLKASGFAAVALLGAALAILYAGKVIVAVATYGWPDPSGSEANFQVGIPFMLMAGTATLAQWAFRRALGVLR
jgi:hypothetical protein